MQEPSLPTRNTRNINRREPRAPSEDPVPLNADQVLNQLQSDMKYGIVTINEVRQSRGLEPVPWGDKPWLPLQWAPSDFARREEYAPHTGRNRRTGEGAGGPEEQEDQT